MEIVEKYHCDLGDQIGDIVELEINGRCQAVLIGSNNYPTTESATGWLGSFLNDPKSEEHITNKMFDCQRDTGYKYYQYNLI